MTEGITDGLCVDTVDECCVIWLVNEDRYKRIPRSRLPSTTNIGTWLKLGKDESELVEKDVRISIDRGRLLVNDWFLMTRSGAFSRSLGTVDVDDDVEYDSDRIFYTECEWDSRKRKMVINNFSTSESKSKDSEEYEAAMFALDAKSTRSFWTRGVVCGKSKNNFFLSTNAGYAMMFCKLAESSPVRIRVGLYCRALVERMDCEKECRLRVISVQEEQPPSTHKQALVDNKYALQISCTGTLAEMVGAHRSPSDWIFSVPFLGEVSLLDVDRPPNMFFSLGDRVQMIVVQRPKNSQSKYSLWLVWKVLKWLDKPGLLPNPKTKSILETPKVETVVNKPKPKAFFASSNKSFIGLVTAVRSNYRGYVFCNDFPNDLEITPKKDDSFDPSYVGKWIEFRRVKHKYIQLPVEIIPDVYPTRVTSIPEAILESELGSIRDDDGIIKERGAYELWIVRYFRPNHSSQWKISFSERGRRQGAGDAPVQRTFSNNSYREGGYEEDGQSEIRTHSSNEKLMKRGQKQIVHSATRNREYHPGEGMTVSVRLDEPVPRSPSPILVPPPHATPSHLAAALRRVIFMDAVCDAISDYSEDVMNSLTDLLYPPDYYEQLSKKSSKK